MRSWVWDALWKPAKGRANFNADRQKILSLAGTSLGLEVKVDSHFSCHKKDRICISSKGFTQPPTLCPQSRGSHCQGQHRGKATAKSCPAPSLSNSCVGKELFLLDLPMLLLPFLQPRLQDKTTSREVVHRGRAGAGAAPKPSRFSLQLLETSRISSTIRVSRGNSPSLGYNVAHTKLAHTLLGQDNGFRRNVCNSKHLRP